MAGVDHLLDTVVAERMTLAGFERRGRQFQLDAVSDGLVGVWFEDFPLPDGDLRFKIRWFATSRVLREFLDQNGLGRSSNRLTLVQSSVAAPPDLRESPNVPAIWSCRSPQQDHFIDAFASKLDQDIVPQWVACTTRDGLAGYIAINGPGQPSVLNDAVRELFLHVDDGEPSTLQEFMRLAAAVTPEDACLPWLRDRLMRRLAAS